MQSSTEEKCVKRMEQIVQDCLQKVEMAQSDCKQRLAAMEQQMQQLVSSKHATAQLNGQSEIPVPAAPTVSQSVAHPSSDAK
jgi:hypothetical protein